MYGFMCCCIQICIEIFTEQHHDFENLSCFEGLKNWMGMTVSVAEQAGLCLTWSQGYKTFFMLDSAEHEIYPAHKC